MYLCGEAELAIGDPQAKQRSRQYFAQASRQCISLSVLSKLVRELDANGVDNGDNHDEDDTLGRECIANLYGAITRWGFHGTRFRDKMAEGAGHLAEDEHRRFHQGLEFLGRLLGWESIRPTNDGDPDCVWTIGHDLYVTLEAKSEQKQDGKIGKGDVQQAVGHVDWVREHLNPAEDARVFAVIVTSREKPAVSAKPHADGLHHMSPAAIRELGARAITAVEGIRNRVAGVDEHEAFAIIRQKLSHGDLMPDDIVALLTATAVTDL